MTTPVGVDGRWFRKRGVNVVAVTLLVFLLPHGVRSQDTVGCGANFTEPSGTLFHSSDLGRECTWTITTYDLHSVQLTYELSNITQSFDCSDGFVQVGEEDGLSVIAGYSRFCEAEVQRQTSTSHSGTLTIRFVTLSTDTVFSINASWTTECQRTFRRNGDILRSPGFPDTYPASQSCSFTMSSSGLNYAKKLTFTDFNLPENTQQSCDTDYVEIVDYSAFPSSHRYCGSNMPPVFDSVDSLRFVSSEEATAGFGFRAILTMAIRCHDTNLTGNTGSIYFSLDNTGTGQEEGGCTWTITVEEGYNILLVFENLQLQKSQGCSAEYFKVYEGHTATDSSLLETFCGSAHYRIVNSTSNKLTLDYYTSGTSSYTSAHFRYFATNETDDCRVIHLTDPQGTLGMQHSYSHGYKRNGVCVWNITVEEGNLIQMSIGDLNIAMYQGFNYMNFCNSSFLKIYDGTEEDEQNLIKILCRQSYNTGLLTSTTNNLLLVLTLQEDTGYAYVQFSAEYASVNASQFNRSCGGNLTGSEGEITSPNYPNHYDNLMECRWLITVDPTYMVRLDVNTSFPCDSDSLTIWAGNVTVGPSVFKESCSSNQQLDYLPLGNQVVLLFQSNWETTDIGFRATWSTVCQREIYHTNHSSFQSPNYPDNYPGNLSCSYRFVPYYGGYSMVIAFTDFQIEGAMNGSCTNDYLQVTYENLLGGVTLPEELRALRLCGNTLPETLTLFPPLTVRFVTNDVTSGVGYKGNYHFVKASGCGETFFAGPNGTVSSPNYPGTFPPFTICTYTIQVEPGQTVYLVFDFMQLQYGTLLAGIQDEDCLSAVTPMGAPALLSVFDGGTTSNDSFIDTYCGAHIPNPITSTSNMMTLLFNATNNSYLRGFSATYTASGASVLFDDCGGELSGQGGEIVSPGYPDVYPKNAVCVWILTGAEGDRIRVTFTDFDLEDSQDCQLDLLEFRDGPSESDTRLNRYCGDVLPLDVTSTGNVMHLKFLTDLQNVRTGFNASWISLCEETFRASSGTLQSPANTGGRRQCTFIIEQWQGYLVHLQFTHFNLGDGSDNCQNTYLEVRDGGYDGAPLLGNRYCGNSTPLPLTSSQNMMWIRYVTDGSSNSTGFQASYDRAEPSCDTVILSPKRGTFTTPQYPSNYANRMNCTWEIRADPNDVIQLTFDTFTLEGPTSYCPFDWVEIYDGSARLGKWCQLSAPDNITTSSPGNTLRVVFSSDWSVTYQGFSASYIAYDPYSDELSRQYALYPYGEAIGDRKLPRHHFKARKLIVDTGFPVGDELHSEVFIANKGLVSFGKRDKGRRLKLKPYKRMICPYLSDIGARNTDGGVYYQLHTDNQAILDKASREVREFTEFRQYTASLVLVVTWDRVAHINSRNGTEERATVQLALISDGRRSFGLVFYKAGAMRWSVLDNEPLIIGFSNGHREQVVSNVYSNTTEAFTKMDRIKGNTGRYGMWIYPLGDSYSADQECQDWYRRNLPLKEERLAGFQRLPQCPCSWWWLWGNWRWAYWRDDYNVMCFRMTVGRSRQLAPYGKECCYSWDWSWWSVWGQYLTDAPHAGSATAFNPAFWSLRADYQREDRRAHDVCCYNTTNPDYYCNKYYELRPVGECSTRIPFSFSWTWGDPHIKTLDGGEYTFNGLGEYTMITLTSGDLSFTLQGRTGLAETESGSVTNATVFTAFGAEENGVRVFVGLDPNTNDSLIIYASNIDYSTAFRDAGDNEILVDSENYMLKRSNQSFVVIFASEIQLTISIGYKALDISIGMPLDYRGMTRGLLGNFNGVTGDDFVLPDGTTLASDLTDRQIYENFGPQWAVTSSNTVLRYGPREGPADFTHPEFRPIFLDEVPAATRQAADDLCGATNVACIYDYVATGSTAIANSSKATADSAAEREGVTQNTVPVLTFNTTISGTSGETLNFNLQGHDPDTKDVLTYHVVDDGNGAVQVNSATGDVALSMDSAQPVSYSFYVKDSSNAQSPIRQVTLIACSGCNGHGTCDFTRTTTSTVIRGFQVAACDCLPAWTGTDCQDDYDACDESPCDVYQTCTDLTPEQQGGSDVGYTCTGCSDGFDVHPDDPTRCVDIDECSQQHNCSMLCINVPGSYRCDCRDGYRLSSDGVSCDDINECVEKTDWCQQSCINNKGSFQCQCFAGYTLSQKGTCEADSTTTDLCSTAGCDHGCTSTTDPAGNPVAQCFCNSGYKLDPSNNSSCVDRDECQEGVCSQSCVNTQGSFVCTCYVGHVMGSDQRTCNPCPSLRYGVECRGVCSCNGRMQACDPVTGCVCQNGWTGSECQHDVDECAEDPDVCGEGKLCFNTDGSYTCRCPQGYAEDSQGACADIDECSEESVLNTCGELEQCHNVPGSHYCTCNKGYTRRNGQCTDIDECEGSQNQCQQLCTNVPGSFNCDCYYGYRLDQNRKSCSQVADVCKEFEGLECDHGCSLDDSDRAFCFCRPGYKLATDLQTCLDEDECSLGTAGCSDVSLCVNTDDGYMCVCPTGQMLDNDGKTCLPCPPQTFGENCAKSCACGIGASHCDVIRGCVCKSGWSGERCDQDVDECQTVQTQAECLAQSARCVNSQGGYACRCAPGFTKNASNSCEDVNECVSNPCEQQCENSPGSYRCLCNKGYTFNTDTGTCEDVDECSVSVTNLCTQRCDNTPGSYRCSCDVSGYSLDNDGFTCTATAACSRTDCPTENGGCSQENCFCNSGYQLTGSATMSCEWIDEDLCAGDVCQQTCSESSDGRSFICSCQDGYVLNEDQRTCRVCPAGTFGPDCSGFCACNTQNSVSCDHVSGTCNCTAGWEGSACDVDIDECAAPSSVTCPANSNCINTAGSYVCACETGFYKDSSGLCQECGPNSYGENCAQQCMCTSNAQSCNSVDGACSCKAGWEGTRCESDVNECVTNQHDCSGDHVICINQGGGFSCGCESGFKYNGTVCLDVDECLADTDNCDQVCTNTVGSFFCSCGPGYLGTGNDCTELTRVTVVVTVQITAPADLSNPYGATYSTWKQLAEKALYSRLKISVPGLQAIIITALRLGSLVVESQAVIDSATDPAAPSDLTLALVDLDESQLTIGNQTGVVGLSVSGTLLDSSMSVCDVYKTITDCQSGTQCQVTDGAPSCKPTDEDKTFDAMVIAIAVSTIVALLAVGIGVTVFVCKKKASKTGPLLDDRAPSATPSGNRASFNALPSNRKNSWTANL